MLTGWLVRALGRILAIFPLTWVRAVARGLGLLIYWVGVRRNGKLVQVTLQNIGHCFPNLVAQAKARLAKHSLQNMCCSFFEIGAVWYWPTPRWQQAIEKVHGIELIDAARAAQQPILVLTPHYGNWETLGLVLGRYEMVALYDTPKISGLDEPLRQARERAGARLHPIGVEGTKAVLRQLRDKGMVVILPDQVPKSDAGVHVPFFDQPALTMTFVHGLIQKTQPVVLLASVPRTKTGFELHVEKLDPDIMDPDPLVSLTVMNKAIEALVMRDPAQYQWEYKRFKRLPEGADSPYPEKKRRH